MKENQEKDEGPSEMEKEVSSFTPIKAVMPISMMVILIVVTLLLALWIGPYFDALGITSEMSKYADNPLYAFVFLGFVIGFAVFILVLRKLLKRRRFKLKYLFAAAVLLSSLYILTPLVDIVANGFPEVWDEYELDINGIRGALPLDPEDPGKGIVVVTDSSFHVLERKKYEYEEVWKTEGIESTFDPSFSNGLWVFAGKDHGNNSYWTLDSDGIAQEFGIIESPNATFELLGVSAAFANGTHYLISFWEGVEGSWSVLAFEPGSIGPGTWIENIGHNEGPFYPIFGWSDGRVQYHVDDSIEYMVLSGSEGGLIKTSGGASKIENGTWITARGESVLYFTNDPFNLPGRSDPSYHNVVVKIVWIDGSALGTMTNIYATGSVLDGYHVSYVHENGPELGSISDYRLIYLSGKEVGVITPDSNEEYSFTEEPVSVFQDGPDGDIYLVFDGAVLIGQFDGTERMQVWVQVTAFLIAVGMMALLLKIPKWWIIDLSGILMGAGVVAMMGTSFPILFTLLLMVLLAVYDAISVYKTKHMISLADSVVESKMPILLVFPMRLDYRYEDETNLMDPKRKRESLFMGLGDVIIPGILVISSFAWLPKADGLLGLSGPLSVALFTMLGMLFGYAILIRWVLKGSAHAGLPPLNGGAILGFLIGHLLVYGSFIFW